MNVEIKPTNGFEITTGIITFVGFVTRVGPPLMLFELINKLSDVVTSRPIALPSKIYNYIIKQIER